MPHTAVDEDDIFDGIGTDPDPKNETVVKPKILRLDRLSASTFKTAVSCPKQFELMYLWKVFLPTSEGLFFGRVTDEAVSYNYAQKVHSDKDLPRDEIKDFFRTKFKETKDQVDDWGGADPDDVLEEGTGALDIFYNDVMRQVRPRAVQEKLRMSFSNSPLVVSGVPDVIEKTEVIADTKTAKRAKSDSFLQAPQPVFYSLLLDWSHEKPREFRYDILVRTKKPKVQQMKTLVTKEYRDATLHQIAAVHEEINAKLQAGQTFLPTAFYRGGWECGYCSVSEICRKVTGLPIPKPAATEKEIASADSKINKEIIEKAKSGVKPVSEIKRNIIA